MADKNRIDFEGIYHESHATPGRLRLAEKAIGWKGAKEPVILEATDLKKLSWLRASRGYRLRVVMKDDTNLKFDGFKSSDIDELGKAIKAFYKLTLDVKEVSVKGWNWGEADFQGSNLLFNVSKKPMFELPLAQAIGSNKPGKNEVTINFIDPGQTAKEGINPKEVDELVDVTFYIPGTVAKETDSQNGSGDEEEEMNADQAFYETVKSKLEFSQMTTENIVQFSETLCLAPRGRHNIDMYQDFLRLRGKTNDYKILYSNIIKLFLLLKPGDTHVLFVMGLDPPLRQGQTKYPFLVFQFDRGDEIDVDLNLDDDTLTEKYDGKLQKHYDAPTYEVVSTIFRALTGKKVTVPGNYRSQHGDHAVKCSLKANEGHLYPLEKGFIFVPKLTTFIPFSDISIVSFSRLSPSSGGGSLKTFDMKFHMKGGSDIQFSSINREEFANIEDFLKSKSIRTKAEKSEETVASYTELDDDVDMDEDEEDEVDDGRKRRRMDDVGGDDEDDESPDEDFAPDESGSDALEYDSEAQDSGSSAEEEEE